MKRTLCMECDSLEWLYIRDVTYADYGDVTRALQLIAPHRPHWESDTRYPLVVYLPGSAFYRQDMYCGIPHFARLAQRGFVVAALQYRESQIAKFPAQIRDVHNALSFLKDNAAAYHIDPERIFLMGHSSGGYNSLMAAFTCGLPEFDGGANHTLRGVVAMSAPSYLNYEVQILDRNKIGYEPEDFRPELDMLGLARFEDDPELFQKSRVENYVNRNIPPVLLFHGDADGDVFVENSRKLYRRLTEAGKEALYYELPGIGHGGAWLWDGQILGLVEDFLRQKL